MQGLDLGPYTFGTDMQLGLHVSPLTIGEVCVCVCSVCLRLCCLLLNPLFLD